MAVYTSTNRGALAGRKIIVINPPLRVRATGLFYVEFYTAYSPLRYKPSVYEAQIDYQDIICRQIAAVVGAVLSHSDDHH